MRSMSRRLELLEDTSRESAAAEIRRVWMGLADEEMALLLAPYFHGRELTSRVRAAELRTRAAGIERL